MKKFLLAAVLLLGLSGHSMAVTTYFSETFADLSAWTRKPSASFATVSGNVLSFTGGNGAGDIYTNASFGAGYLNFDYMGTAGSTGGGFVGISPTVGGSPNWLAGAQPSGWPTPTSLTNDGTWHHYSIAVGAGHVSLEQYANNTSGQAKFRNMSLTDVAVAAVPEPETYAMMLLGLGLIGSVLRRRK